MNSVIHADIFFFVATICTAVLTVFLVIIFIYAIKLLSDAREIVDKARVESDFFFDELRLLGARMNQTRFGALSVFRFMKRIASRIAGQHYP